jgi:hypothetical protein
MDGKTKEIAKDMLQDLSTMAIRIDSVVDRLSEEQVESIYQAWSRLNVIDSDLFI